MLDSLKLTDFSEVIGSCFNLYHDTELPLPLELIEATPMGTQEPEEDEDEEELGRREPFSLLFRGPREVELPQRLYHLEHDRLGPLNIFLVPIARKKDGMRYEAVFA